MKRILTVIFLLTTIISFTNTKTKNNTVKPTKTITKQTNHDYLLGWWTFIEIKKHNNKYYINNFDDTFDENWYELKQTGKNTFRATGVTDDGEKFDRTVIYNKDHIVLINNVNKSKFTLNRKTNNDNMN